MSFGHWIREAREDAGMGMNALARAINISPAYWSRIERDMERAPKDELIIAACAALKLDTDRAFIEAERLPPDVQGDLEMAVRAYRAFKGIAKA